MRLERRPRRRSPLCLALACALLLHRTGPARADEIRRRVGQLTIVADTALAYPGGVLVVRFPMTRWLGSLFPIFEGRRAPVYNGGPGGPRALVPIPATTPAGTGTLGVELYARTGVQRIQLEFPIAERELPPRTQTIPEEKRELLLRPAALRDGRRLMVAVRTATAAAQWTSAFRAPLVVPATPSFGSHETYAGGSLAGPSVEMMMDGGLGEYHRGLDYPVAPGTMVQAPAGGSVVLAAPLALTGQTLVIDHGQGIVSALCHLSRIDVREGDRVEARTPVGLSGDTGIAAFPHLHWAVYLHGIAVDPEAILKLFGNGNE